MKIGLYFGSFNPIHIGHLLIATHLVNFSYVENVWFVISPQNPLKKQNSLLNANQRKELIDLAIQGEKNLISCDIEFFLPTPSYTIDTLSYLKQDYFDYEFTIIMGSDSFMHITKWKEYKTLIKEYPVLIYKRLGFKIKKYKGANIKVINTPLLDISSTYVREMIKKGKSIKFLVPDNVKEEIEKNNYYK